MAEVEITLKNGEKVKANDHVYCSPSWSVRDGTPYSIARIMEFLPTDHASKAVKGKNRGPLTRVRLAWYYRPSDVSDRPVADSRLLLAAIYSEVCDISQLRGRCHVVHRDKISDLAGWKKRPDRFYFNKLFDPYIKKEFDILQSTDVRNLPENIKNVLCDRYEYVVAEKEVIPDLTDNIRLCQSCEEWCATPDTVQCDRCKKYFHMKCVQPPLLAKPSRGYGWTCAPCARQHEEDVDSHKVRHGTPSSGKPRSNAPAVRARGRPRKDRTQAEREENLEIKHFKMWPFRYFGQYTVAEDTLDEEDHIFPRTATRVGPKFQANIPPLAGPSEPVPDVEERGGDATIEVLSVVNQMPKEVAVEMRQNIDKMERNTGVDFLTELFRRASMAFLEQKPQWTVNMKVTARQEKWKNSVTHFDTPWSRQEVAAFEDALLVHGAELRAVREEVGTRSMPEVVRFYGHWKSVKLGEENARIRALRLTREERPAASPAPAEAAVDDNDSIVTSPTKANCSCGACRTRESKVWWKAPKGLSTDVLCQNCGTNWRKYADLNMRPQREEALAASKAKQQAAGEKREGTPLSAPAAKRVKATTSSSQSSTPPVQTAVPHVRCLACAKNGPLGKVLRCQQCNFRVHAGVCGAIVDPAAVESWTCELCSNEKTQELSLKTHCVLCPKQKKSHKKNALLPPADSYLRACKPTEGQGWAHILCATFTPETSFTDATRLCLVEGISTIPWNRWSSTCTFCSEQGGVVIKCSDCPKEFHSSCAWKHGLRFGFEIQPVKSSRRDATLITTFRDETGLMNPIVLCREHDISRRDIYDLCETNEGGETALQVYTRIYKQAPVQQAHGLLRKARRLDSVLNIKPDNSQDESEPQPDRECYRCHTLHSPYFHKAPPSLGSFMPQVLSESWLCHKCHYEASENLGAGNAGIMAS